MAVNCRNRIPDMNATDNHLANYECEKFYGPYDIAPHNIRKSVKNNFKRMGKDNDKPFPGCCNMCMNFDFSMITNWVFFFIFFIIFHFRLVSSMK